MIECPTDANGDCVACEGTGWIDDTWCHDHECCSPSQCVACCQHPNPHDGNYCFHCGARLGEDGIWFIL